MSAASGGTTAVGPKRVVFCLGNLGIGGTELNAVRTAERLDRERFELHAVTLQEDGPLRERYEAAGVPLHPLPLESLHHPTTITRGVQLARLLRRLAADVFHAHDIYSNVFGVPWARMAGVPTVIASRRWWKRAPGPMHRLANRYSYLLAHRVLANSPAVASLLREEDRISPAKVRMVPNFVDEEAFEDPGERHRRSFLRTLNVPEGSTVLGMLANLRPIKDHPTLLRAVANLAADRHRIHVILAGDGPARSALETLAVDLGIADRVHFAGRVPHRPNPHFYFDISLLTSRSEAFPNSLIEAMAAGRPVVATRVGGVPDAIDHGRSGLLVTEGDDEALASAIAAVLDDPYRAARLGSEARAVAWRRYGAAQVLEALSNLYEDAPSSNRDEVARSAGVRGRRPVEERGD